MNMENLDVVVERYTNIKNLIIEGKVIWIVDVRYKGSCDLKHLFIHHPV